MKWNKIFELLLHKNESYFYSNKDWWLRYGIISTTTKYLPLIKFFQKFVHLVTKETTTSVKNLRWNMRHLMCEECKEVGKESRFSTRFFTVNVISNQDVIVKLCRKCENITQLCVFGKHQILAMKLVMARERNLSFYSKHFLNSLFTFYSKNVSNIISSIKINGDTVEIMIYRNVYKNRMTELFCHSLKL